MRAPAIAAGRPADNKSGRAASGAPEPLNQHDRCRDQPSAGLSIPVAQSIPTLREYLLIEQAGVHVEQRVRGQHARWTSSICERLDAGVKLVGVPITLKVSEIYREVFRRRRAPAQALRERGR